MNYRTEMWSQTTMTKLHQRVVLLALTTLVSCMDGIPAKDASTDTEVVVSDLDVGSPADIPVVDMGEKVEVVDLVEMADLFEVAEIVDLVETVDLPSEPKDLVTEHQYHPPEPDIVLELPVEVVDPPDSLCAGECQLDTIRCSVNRLGYWTCLEGESGCHEWQEPLKCAPGLVCSCRNSRTCLPDGPPCVCVPKCDGKECGDNGCDGTCGECAELHLCGEGLCVCQPNCEDKVCGDDGCGGECGTCAGAQDLCLEGECICQPACEGKDCGHDGCGGRCGACTGNNFCNPDQLCEWIFEICADGWCLVRAGVFFMGPPGDETCAGTDEALRPVAITRDFVMRQFEITQTDWLEVLGNVGNPSSHLNCGGDCPVEQITWLDATKFCNAWSALEGLEKCYEIVENNGVTSVTWPKGPECTGYRLPTDAEWEYAYRAGKETAFYNGEISLCNGSDPNLSAIGWYKANSLNKTHFYGYKEANGWGLWDMSGNVTEWVWDWYQNSIPATFSADPTGPESGSDRVIRNCAFPDYPKHCRAAYRQSGKPTLAKGSLGLRVVRTVGGGQGVPE
jgi:formylglycine-generating enzyme required for sulfatase activity